MAAFQGFWPRWRLALGPAAVRGVLCFGPNRGRKITYASPSRWLSDLSLPDPAEAQQDLVRAYLAAYGPATPAHLARWLATSPAWAKGLFERADLDEVDLEGEPAWVWSGDTTFDAPEAPAVRLLPYFDAFQVGSQPRALLFPGRASERALAGSQAGNYPVLLLDGVVGGVWHQKRSGRRVKITVEPLGRLTKTQRSGLEVGGRAGRRDRPGAARPHRRNGVGRAARLRSLVERRESAVSSRIPQHFHVVRRQPPGHPKMESAHSGWSMNGFRLCWICS